ncbi:hypothetical protein [Bradyrhizobium sp. ORS 285]|uniref:hypothetical protein n=1 Tax=Bradyrhizobium sp. ORS 285 TaxID=115808 RepID=UPI0005572682|nr:hypothetical protein [Bradyrhizobium sp. ORS 285]
MFGWIKKRLVRESSADDPSTEFVRTLLAEFARQALVVQSYDPARRSFVVALQDGSQVTAFIDNTFLEWQHRAPSRQKELIARFVRSLIETHRHDPISSESLADELMPGIRSRVLVSDMMIRDWIAGGRADDSQAAAFLPFAADLVVCAIRDRPDSMSLIKGSELAAADLPLDRALQQAMTNFRASMPQPVFEPLGDGVFGCVNLADYQSALLLLSPGEDYALPPVDGTPVLAVPGRNVVYVTGSNDRAGVVRLLEIAAGATQTPHFCTVSLLQWDGERWAEATFAEAALDRRYREIIQRQLAADYAAQKQLLDHYHQVYGQDVHVADLQLYRANDGAAMFSIATLGSGTYGTLLPRADRLAFVRQVIDPTTGLALPKQGDVIHVPWSDAMVIVGGLFAPVPHLYPPRFRALGFPDAEAWTRLQAMAG